MTRTISDSERLVIAKLNRTETELKQAKDTITQYAKQLKAQTQYITELKDANKMLAAQVNFLVMPNRLPYWDKKFYYNIHCNRQRADWNEPLSYDWFIWRLRKWMNVHDAIYTPAAKRRDRWEYKATPEDNARRRQKLNEENVMILDFDEIEQLETAMEKTESIDDVLSKYKDWDSINLKKIIYNWKTIHIKPEPEVTQKIRQEVKPYWESIVDIIERRKKNKNRIQMPKPKQSLLDRFISLFR